MNLNMNTDRKPMFVALAVIVGVVILGGVYMMSRRSTAIPQTTAITPTSDIIPTVDSSVKVTLAPAEAGKEVVLSVSGVPKTTASIDYELSYNTAAQGLQGVIGTLTVKPGETTAKKQLTLGTCSSGTCVYHKVEGPVQLTLKFSGEYGQKIYEKEHELDTK